MRIAEADILIVPDRDDLPPGHWQRRWGERFANGQVLAPEGGAEARIAAIRHAVMMATRPVVLIAHGFGVLAAVHAAGRLVDTKVRGALLVAPPDLDRGAGLPAGSRGFAPVPRDPLPFPSILVASASDPRCTLERAADLAAAWGSDFHAAGDAGRIDVESGHGPWPEGLMMFTRLMQRIRG